MHTITSAEAKIDSIACKVLKAKEWSVQAKNSFGFAH